MAGTVGGLMVSFIGITVDLATFWSLVYPKTDPSKYKEGWVIVKIKGWSETSYDQAEKLEGPGWFLGRFFAQRLRGTSRLTPMIYTDYKPKEAIINGGSSEADDVSVLINVDYEGEVRGWANKANKRNSQTLHARLIQAYSSQEPVCIFVYGIRNNRTSEFLNILQFQEIRKDFVNQYNALAKNDDATTDRQSQLANLALRACGSPTLYR